MDLRKSPTFSKTIGSFFTGFGAGLIGAVVFGAVILLSWSIVGESLMSTISSSANEFGVETKIEKPHDLFLFFVMLAMFLSILATSITYVALSSIANEQYNKRATVMTHAFFANLIFLVLTIPLYLGFSGLTVQGLMLAAMMHVGISALFTFIVQELFAEKKYLIVRIYGVLLSLLVFSGVVFMLIEKNTSILAFLALPIIYALLNFFKEVTESIYIWFYQTYGVDVLNMETRYGEDFQEQLQKGKE